MSVDCSPLIVAIAAFGSVPMVMVVSPLLKGEKTAYCVPVSVLSLSMELLDFHVLELVTSAGVGAVTATFVVPAWARGYEGGSLSLPTVMLGSAVTGTLEVPVVCCMPLIVQTLDASAG